MDFPATLDLTIVGYIPLYQIILSNIPFISHHIHVFAVVVSYDYPFLSMIKPFLTMLLVIDPYKLII
jgi:hypothetical protein